MQTGDVIKTGFVRAVHRGRNDQFFAPKRKHETWFYNAFSFGAAHVSEWFALGVESSRAFWITTADVWHIGEDDDHYAMDITLNPDGNEIVVTASWTYEVSLLTKKEYRQKRKRRRKGTQRRQPREAERRTKAITARYRLSTKERMALTVGAKWPARQIARYVVDVATRHGRK